MKVLVIQPKIGMGDMILYLPYIHAISRRYQTNVSLLAKDNSRAKELLSDDKHINEIILLDRKKNKSGLHDGVSGFFKLINQIKVKKFDRIFIFNSSLRYFLIAKIAGIKNIFQYPLFTKKDNVVISAKILTEQVLNKIVSTQPVVNLTNDKIKQANKKFTDKHKHICVGFSASGPTKRWGIEKYIKLCEKINLKFPCKFYLAGGKHDRELIKKIFDSKIGSNSFSFAELNIKDTLPIIKNCNLYIGNDTGWLHISSALGLKCLALFMDSPVMAYGKYSRNIFTIIPEGETDETTTHNTLGEERISFEKVYSKAIELLN
jgi:heptosyltransferase-2